MDDLIRFTAEGTMTYITAWVNKVSSAIGDVTRGQLVRDLLEECPSDQLSVDISHVAASGSRATAYFSITLVRPCDEPEITAGEIRSSINKTADRLGAESFNVELSAARLEVGDEFDPEESTQDDESDDEDDTVGMGRAMDALQTAERYCQEHGLSDLQTHIAEAYQRLGRDAPDEEWGETEQELKP